MVLMLTDGVDRYYDTSMVDDPYVGTAIQDAMKRGVAVYSIYLRGAGFSRRGFWSTNIAQSRLQRCQRRNRRLRLFPGPDQSRVHLPVPQGF